VNNLAALYSSQGRYTEAEPLLRQTLEIRRRVLGGTHPEVASSLANLAAVADAQGRFEEAEGLLREAIIIQQSLGEHHPDILRTQRSLAGALASQGRLEEAKGLLREVLEAAQRKFGPEHPETLTSRRALDALTLEQWVPHARDHPHISISLRSNLMTTGSWMPQNCDRLLGAFMTTIVAGLIGFFSAIISLKDQISDLRNENTQLRVALEDAYMREQAIAWG